MTRKRRVKTCPICPAPMMPILTHLSAERFLVRQHIACRGELNATTPLIGSLCSCSAKRFDFCYWPIASFRCRTIIGRFWSEADIGRVYEYTLCLIPPKHPAFG